MALESKGDFDQADWIAWGVGTAASLLLLAAVLLMGFIRLNWILTGSDASETQYTAIKGIELGGMGLRDRRHLGRPDPAVRPELSRDENEN